MGMVALRASAVAGNVDTDFTVPTGIAYTLLYGQVILTTDATVANRRVLLQVLDATPAVFADVHAGAVVPASQATQHHMLMQGVYREATFIGGSLQVPIPDDMIMPPGWTLRVSIENGVAGDSYDVALAVNES